MSAPDSRALDVRFSPLSFIKGSRWIWTLIILVLMVGEFILAGWQWQRYQLRQAEGALLAQQLRREAVTLPLAADQAAAADHHFRKASVQGQYDFDHQFVWVGPKDRMAAGPHLVAPLVMADNQAILVDRGWISSEEGTPAAWDKYSQQPTGPLEGILLPPAPVEDPEFLATQPRPVMFWSKMDVDAIQAQIPYDLLPVYLHLEPVEGVPLDEYPIRTWYTLRTHPSMHLGYAVQWVMAAVILGFLYAMIVRFLDRRALLRLAENNGSAPSMEGQQPAETAT